MDDEASARTILGKTPFLVFSTHADPTVRPAALGGHCMSKVTAHMLIYRQRPPPLAFSTTPYRLHRSFHLPAPRAQTSLTAASCLPALLP